MSEPPIEQLEKDFRGMDIPNLGDDELTGLARRLDNLFRLRRKGECANGISPVEIEKSIRSLYAEVEGQYAAELFKQAPVPEPILETECGLGMHPPAEVVDPGAVYGVGD